MLLSKNKLNSLYEKNFNKNKNKKNKSKSNIYSGGGAQPPNDPRDPRKNNNGNNNFKDYEEYEIENKRLNELGSKSEVFGKLKNTYQYQKLGYYKLMDDSMPLIPGAKYITWDYSGAEIECFNSVGRHIGVVKAIDFLKGKDFKIYDPKSGRNIINDIK